MTLPDRLLRFWYAMNGLSARCLRTPWGAIVTDPRYPDVWDANHAAVLEPEKAPSLDAIRSELLAALVEAGAATEHVEVWDPDPSSPLVRELRARGGINEDAVMAVRREPALPAAPGVAIERPDARDDAFWDWYGTTRDDFGHQLSAHVMRQLMDRDRRVFTPAGARWLVGVVDGEMAGVLSLHSIEGVGYIDNVVTLPRFRRRGVATTLMLAAMSTSREDGDAELHLLAERGGRPQALYERLGFDALAAVMTVTRRLPDGPAQVEAPSAR